MLSKEELNAVNHQNAVTDAMCRGEELKSIRTWIGREYHTVDPKDPRIPPGTKERLEWLEGSAELKH